MPNGGHRWTLDEERDALALTPTQFAERHPSITPDAYRIRRNLLLKKGYRLTSPVGETAAAGLRRTACKVCAFVSKRPPAERAEWEEDLRAPVKGTESVSHRAIETALRNAGADVEESSVRRHRRNHIGR